MAGIWDVLSAMPNLGGLLSPRSAHADVVKADEGTYTLTGDDVQRFRALIGSMIQQAQQPNPAPAQQESMPQRTVAGQDGEAAPAQASQEAPPSPEDAAKYEKEEINPAYWLVQYLRAQNMVSPEDAAALQGTPLSQLLAQSPYRHLYDVHQQELGRLDPEIDALKRSLREQGDQGDDVDWDWIRANRLQQRLEQRPQMR